MGVLCAVEHISNETAMHARAQANKSLAKVNRASHGPRVRAKAGKIQSKIQRCQRFAQGHYIENWSLKVWKTQNPRQTWKLKNLHKHVPLTLPGTMVGMVTNGTMAGVLMNGMMTGVLLDGTKVQNKRMTLPQAHFHLEAWMSVPPIESCSEHIPIELWSSCDGRFYRTATGEWIPDGGAWQFQGHDENGLLRSLSGGLTGVHKVLCSAAGHRGAKDDKMSTSDMTVDT